MVVVTFSEVPTNYFLLPSPLLNGHFEKMYHTSAKRHTVYGIKWSLTFFLLAQEEVATGGGQFVVG